MTDDKKASTSAALKAQYHLYCSQNKRRISLKSFAQIILKDSDPVAIAWFGHKAGLLERKAKAARLKNKGSQLADIRIAVRTSRSKSSNKNTNPRSKV